MGQWFGIRAFTCLAAIGLGLGLAGGKLQAQADVGDKVYQRTLKGTVWVLSAQQEAGAKLRITVSGTGSLIDRSRRLVITNYHVIADAERDKSMRVLAVFPAHGTDGKLIQEKDKYFDLIRRGQAVNATVLHVDKKRDLAVLELATLPASAQVIRLASQSTGPGKRVHSIGNPGVSKALWVYTSGTVRAVLHQKWTAKERNRELNFEAQVVETQSPINPGDSGGPMVNDNGDLVAVTQGMSTNAQSISIFVDVSEVKTFLASHKLLPRNTPLLAKSGTEDKPKTENVAEVEKPGDQIDKTEATAATKLRFAKSLASDGKLEKAKDRYEEIITTFPKTKAAEEAKLLLDKLNK